MDALIFGHSGQDGPYLTRLLHTQGIEAHGFSRSTTWGNIANFSAVADAVRSFEPEYIFHLAANSTTRHDALFDNHAAIATGTCNILEAARLYTPRARIFISGSAMQFANYGEPIDENTPFAAASPYASARIYATYLARYYRAAFGMNIYVGYFFNHDSPLRTEVHVNQKIAQAALRIAGGTNEKVSIGDISVRKEFMFAGDAVEAAWTLVNQDALHEAVIGTGEDYSLEDWLEACFSHAGKDWRDHVTLTPGFTAEYTRLVSNPALIHSLGWAPKVSFTDLVRMMMEQR